MRASLRRWLVYAVAGAGTGLAGSAPGQTVAEPYPGAEPLAADEAFVAFQVVAAARAAGASPDRALAALARRSFVTGARVTAVLDHLEPTSIETHRRPILDREVEDQVFLRSLDGCGLAELVEAVGAEEAGEEYGAALLARLAEGAEAGVRGGFVAREEPDGALVLYEIQRPYLDVQSLRWVDSTRIRVLRIPAPGG